MTFKRVFNMIQQLLVTFPPMLFGAQALLTLLLIKGDICPGQRGRLHKMLPHYFFQSTLSDHLLASLKYATKHGRL